MSGDATEAQIAGLLVGLAAKGTTVEELVGTATVMREKAVGIGFETDGVVIDTCGTGGDVRGTFNISTAAALVVAAAGAKVVKHGNRSASGKSGSADVLEKLGVKLELIGSQLRRCLDEAMRCPPPTAPSGCGRIRGEQIKLEVRHRDEPGTARRCRNQMAEDFRLPIFDFRLNRRSHSQSKIKNRRQQSHDFCNGAGR